MPAIISKTWHLVLPVELDFLVTAFIVVHFILGEIQGFYLKYWWFDLVLHSGAGFIFGIIGFIWSYMLFFMNKVKSQPWVIVIFSVSLAMAVGTIWEIFEFFVDQFFGFNMQKSGHLDTMFDLIVCLFGSLIVGILGYLYLRNHKRGLIRNIIRRWNQYYNRIKHKKKPSPILK